MPRISSKKIIFFKETGNKKLGRYMKEKDPLRNKIFRERLRGNYVLHTKNSISSHYGVERKS